MKWSVVGNNAISHEFLSCLSSKGELDSVAHLPKGEYADVRHFDSLEELLKNGNSDIVYIGETGDQHASLITKSLDAGRHVFCEKTMLDDPDALERMIRQAEQKNLFLGEANSLYYMPLYKELERRIAEDEIGTVKIVRAEFGSRKSEEKDEALFDPAKKGGALLDIGVYALTSCVMFGGDAPASMTDVCIRGRQIDEAWSISYQAGHVMCTVNMQFRTKLPKRLVISGDKAYFEIYNYPRADHADIVYPDFSRKGIQSGCSSDAVRYEIEGVEKMIQKGDYAAAHLHDTLAVCRILHDLEGRSNNENH